MKTLITILFTMCLVFVQNLSAQSNKTLVKTIDPKGAIVLTSEIPGQIKIKETESNLIRVTTNVEIANFNEVILQRLIEAGRYSIQSEIDAAGNCVLTMPSIYKKVIIKDIALVEVLSFEIELPKGMTLKTQTVSVDNAYNNESF